MAEYAVMPKADYEAACNAIRAKTGKTDRIKSGDLAPEIESITGDSALLRYVTFRNESTGDEYVKAVATGDDCVDVVAKGLWPTPTKESDEQYHYTFYSWGAEDGGAADATILQNITENKTVYAIFSKTLRSYTVSWMDGDTVKHTEQVVYGTVPEAYTLADKSGYRFMGWTEEIVAVTGDTAYTAAWYDLDLLPVLAAGDTWFAQGGTTAAKSSITELVIADSYSPEGTDYEAWDASAALDGSVTAYLEGTKLTLAGNGSGGIAANENASYAFSDSGGSDYFSAMTTFTGGELLSMHRVTDMSYMFYLASALLTVDVANWDVSHVTNMSYVFSGLADVADMSLTALDVSKWDTGNVTNMERLFRKCTALTAVEVGLWNTGKVTNMAAMFNYCTSLTYLDLMPKVVNEGTEAEYIAWDTGNVTSFQAFFTAAQNTGNMRLTDDTMEGISKWNTGSATTTRTMFYGCGHITKLDLSKKEVTVGNKTWTAWDTSKITSMYHMFADCMRMTDYSFDGWDTSNVTDMNGMFNDNNALARIDVSMFNTAQANLGQMFEGCYVLEEIIGLDKWDTSANVSMQEMFHQCYKITTLDLSAWDTSKVRNMHHVFSLCYKLTTIYVGDGWDMSSVHSDFEYDMFTGDTALVGGAGTVYDANYTNSAYAKVDGGADDPGYLTYKEA